MLFDTLLLRPTEDRVAGELGPVVADHHFRLASVRDDPIKLPNDAPAREGRVSDKAYVFPGAYIDRSQDPEPAPVGQLVRHKVERPVCFGNQRLRQWHPRDYSPLSATATANRQLFLAVEPEKFFVVHDMPFSPQQNKQPPITKAPALPDDHHPFPKNSVIRTPRIVASHPPLRLQEAGSLPKAFLKSLDRTSKRVRTGEVFAVNVAYFALSFLSNLLRVVAAGRFLTTLPHLENGELIWLT